MIRDVSQILDPQILDPQILDPDSQDWLKNMYIHIFILKNLQCIYP
jgi:hypothetical protein